MTICLLEPDIANNQGAPSDNLGDLIIQDAVLREIHSIFGEQNILRLFTHVPLEDEQFKLMQNCSHILVGGANLPGIAFDYISTRLHGSIRCLLAGKRSLILAIDHRAKEISQETGLPTSERADLDYINHWITSAAATQIRMDVAAINQWKSHFTSSPPAQSPQLLKATAALK